MTEYRDLKHFFRVHPKVALAFSGGVDSALLLAEAKAAGADVKAYFVKSSFQPAFELEDAKRIASEIGAEMQVVLCDVLKDPKIRENPEDRCYKCKHRLFHALIEAASQDGYDTVIDGTNASDDAQDRPGMRALAELAVLSPLRLCGITKDEVRGRSQKFGLFTWDKPAYACLATRIPCGEEITDDKLMRVAAAEAVLAEMGFTDFRVRMFHDSARLQLPAGQLAAAAAAGSEIRACLAPWFDIVLLDLKER